MREPWEDFMRAGGGSVREERTESSRGTVGQFLEHRRVSEAVLTQRPPVEKMTKRQPIDGVEGQRERPLLLVDTSRASGMARVERPALMTDRNHPSSAENKARKRERSSERSP